MKNIICFFVLMMLIIPVLPVTSTSRILPNQDTNVKTFNLLRNDFLIPPDIINKENIQSYSPEPGFYDTSEYLIGNVAVGIIFLESDGSIQPSTEDWGSDIPNANQLIWDGLMHWCRWFNLWYQGNDRWWQYIFFHFDSTIVNISYEPINNPSAITDNTYEQLWVSEAMQQLGYTTGDWMQRTRGYINDLRIKLAPPGFHKTDWAFAIFVVQNRNDADLLFSDGYSAYGYLGGPFIVAPFYYSLVPNDTTFREVIAHEMGHIFYATDEYDGRPEYSGYLNALDIDGSGGIMDNLGLFPSSGTILQVGWRDSDNDGILDVLDTYPETILNPYVPNPTSKNNLTFTGTATNIPYPNNNPNGYGNDVTTNKILSVWYRIDGGSWYNATLIPGNYWESVVNFTFTPISLSPGTHVIEAMAKNIKNNTDPTPSSDTITIIGDNDPPDKPSITGFNSGKAGDEYEYNFVTTDPNGDSVYYYIDWGDSTTSGWLGGYDSGEDVFLKHTWDAQGTYILKAKAKDTNNLESDWATLPVEMPYTYNPLDQLFDWFFQRFPYAFPLLRHLMGY